MAEAFLLNSRQLSIQVANQKVETMKLAEDRGLGIRVFRNNRLGFAFTSDLDALAIEKAINQALANCRYTEEDEFLTIAEKYSAYPELDLYDPQISDISVDEKIRLAKEIELKAKNYDSRIKITERAGYDDSQYEICIVNSQGLEAYYHGGVLWRLFFSCR